MKHPWRYLLMAFALLAAFLLLAACGDGDEEQEVDIFGGLPGGATPTQVETEEPSPTQVETEEPQPSRPPVSPAPGSELKLEDSAFYLDASAVLSGFDELDPHDEGVSNQDLGLGPDFSEVVVYLSEEPFQSTFMYMYVASGELEKAAARAELRDEEYLEEALLLGFSESFGEGELETTVQWSDPAVGDAAKLARMTVNYYGVESEFEALIFLQEKGREAAGVFVFNVWLPGEPPIVDTLTIAQEISARIASR